MKKVVALTVALATALALSGCNSYNPTDRALGGAAIGGAAGAVIGGVASGSVGGALVGGALGAAGGAVIGHATTPRRPHCARFAFDDWGHRHCVAWR